MLAFADGSPRAVQYHIAFVKVLEQPCRPTAPSRSSDLLCKLATVVPDGSMWDKALKKMGEDWKQATGGRVSLIVFSGGSEVATTSPKETQGLLHEEGAMWEKVIKKLGIKGE